MSDPPVDPALEALRDATGEIAHDLGNALQVILGHASLLEMHLEGTPEAEDIAAISTAAGDAIRLTHRLMALAFER